MKVNEINYTGIDLSKYKHIQKCDCEKPPIIISNHFGFYEVIYALSRLSPSFIAAQHIKNQWFVGRIAQGIGCMFVSRNKAIKTDIVKQIKEQVEYIQCNEDANQLMIFPEGVTSKPCYIKPFKFGAFVSMSPIKPMYMKTQSRYYGSNYYATDLLFEMFISLSQPYMTLDVYQLPVIKPVQGATVKEYMDDVYNMYVDYFNLIKTGEINTYKRDEFINNLLLRKLKAKSS